MSRAAVGVDADDAEGRRAERGTGLKAGSQSSGPVSGPQREELDVAHVQAGVVQPASVSLDIGEPGSIA